ncbi:hypothetical protein [Patulibacter americanus]|uniref:hypothetical protein n=1 Tax=Patulibacter americanus TaxID=588672 RepID=UPI0003B72231|nr:hypothetical protein [Patulibacter americanus]
MPDLVPRARPGAGDPLRRVAMGPAALRAVLAIAAAAGGLLAGVPAASADVLRVTAGDTRSPVVLRGDGARRQLPMSEWTDTDGAAGTWFPSGAGGRLVDLHMDVTDPGLFRPRLLSVDGGRGRTLPMRPLRRGPASGYLFWDAPHALWNGDATAVTVGPFVNRAGTRVVQRCSVRTELRCRTQAVPNATPIAVLPDGRGVFATTHPTLVRDFAGQLVDWTPRSRRWVRTTRRRLNAPRREHLWVEAGDGVPRRVLRERTVRPRTGVTNLIAHPGDPQRGGALVQLYRARAVLETRRRGGRLEALLKAYMLDFGDSSWGELTADGRWRDRPEIDRLGFWPSAALPDGAWLGLRPDRHPKDSSASRRLPAVLGSDGTLRDVLVGGQPLTARGLHLAVGLPADAAPPAHRRGDHQTSETLRLDGYERGANSAIVHYEADDVVVAVRVPLDGRPPTVLDRLPASRDGLPIGVDYLPF